MAGLSIEEFPEPSKRLRPSHASRFFETKKAAKKEDRVRQRMTKKCKKILGSSDQPLTKRQRRWLRKSIKLANTPASSVYMRKQRDRIVGHLWAAIADNIETAFTFTLAPRSCEVQGGRLDNLDPRKILQKLRSALIRAGFDGRNGWLVCFIHGEHEPNDDVFVVHVHGVGVGSARSAINNLRKQRDFAPREARAAERVYHRVRMSRKKLTGLPEPLTYVVQSFWPERAAFENVEGKRKRQRNKRRIEEPRHTEVLLWLDKWRLRNTCLMMGIQVTREGFRSTSKAYTNGGQS